MKTQSHEAFQQSKVSILSDGYSMAEQNALLACGMTDDEWYAMPREDRARRTVHLMLKNGMETFIAYENRPKSKGG